jgi:DNA-binding MarR family transcriptional regulator
MNEQEIQDVSSLGNIDRTIHEPARLMIMALLYVIQSADFTFLLSQTDLSWGNLSSHMSRLEAAGYVNVEKRFVGRRPQTTLSLTDTGREAFRKYRRNMKEILDDLP